MGKADMKKLPQLSTELVERNVRWEYRHDRYQLPDGTEESYFYIRTLGSALVVPQRADGRVVMVRQFRYLAQRLSLEFPGGGVRAGQSSEDAARAELAEEVSLSAGVLTELGRFSPCKGLVDEECVVYLATQLGQATAQADASEELEVVDLSEAQVDAAIRDGRLRDGMSLAAWSLFRTA